MRTLGYIRVSTTEQAREGLSLRAQEERIRSYCGLYDLGEPQIIADNGKSAATLKRPGMEKLLRHVSDKDAGFMVQAVVVYKLDRMFRNLLDGLQVLEAFKTQGIAFHSVQEQWNTATAAGEFALNMVLALAQLERRQIGERTSEVLQATKKSPGGSPVLDHRKRKGLLVMGKAPYGLRWQDKALVPVPEEIANIKIMFDLRRKGILSKAIAGVLTAERIMSRTGRAFNERTVRAILARPYYRGYW